MKEYHKINTVFKRDPNNLKRLIEGDWSEECFAYLAENRWAFTEKVDGTNVRVMITPDGIRYGGKTDDAQMPIFLMDRLRSIFDPQTASLQAQFPDGACLYGEGYGAKIQKGGGNYRPDQDFVLFDVKVGEWWLKRDVVQEIAHQFHLDIVPIIGYGTLWQMVDLARDGFKSRWGDFQAEGVVARPTCELVNRNGSRIITKIKHRDFK